MKFLFAFLLVLGCYVPQNIFAQGLCNLPAPENLQITDQTPVHVEVEWGAVPGAWSYKAELKSLSATVYQDIPGNENTATFTIQPDSSYTLKIYAKCDEYSDWGTPASVAVNPVIVLIVVDILSGYQTNIPTDFVAALYTNSTFTNGSEINTGTILKDNYSYQFKFDYAGERNPVRGYFSVEPPNEEIDRTVHTQKVIAPNSLDWNLSQADNTTSTFWKPGSSNEAINFRFIPATVPGSSIEGGKMLITTTGTTATSKISNFKLYEMGPVVFSGQRFDDTKYTSATSPTAAPNPFSDYLNVLLGDTPTAPVTVKMFDVTGQLRKTTQMLASGMSSRSFSVETSELPVGVYVVQIDNGASGLSTFKLIKI